MADLAGAIERILRTLPSWLANLVRGKIEIRHEVRCIQGKIVDASYDIETGHILLWGDIHVDDFDLVIVLSHEFGHLLFHERLLNKDRKEWMKLYAEEPLDFGLREDYSAFQIAEETFCCVCSIFGVVFWLEKSGMKNKAKKIRKKLEKRSPKINQFVEKVFAKKMGEEKELFHTTVEKVRRWIEEEIGPLK